MTWLNSLYDRLLLGGYEAAERETTRRIVARFSRGNVSVQTGNYMTDAEFSDLQERGDAAVRRLAKHVAGQN